MNCKEFFDKQPYLEILYKTMFALSFYGLLRIGEVTFSEHSILAKNVHIAINKRKIMLVLYSSKTHSKESRPQKVKIEANSVHKNFKNSNTIYFCPFNLARKYLNIRGDSKNDNEQFFIFSDGTPVKAANATNVLKNCLKQLGLNEHLYSYHSIRSGMATELIKNNHNSIDQVKRAGRWQSNAVYKYLKL